jgi:hypothetical protein
MLSIIYSNKVSEGAYNKQKIIIIFIAVIIFIFEYNKIILKYVRLDSIL